MDARPPSTESAAEDEPPPDSVWVRGSKAQNYEVFTIKAVTLKKLHNLFSDMPADRERGVCYADFRAHLSKTEFQTDPNLHEYTRDIHVSEDTHVNFAQLIKVLHPGANREKLKTMARMAVKTNVVIDRTVSPELIAAAANLFKLYDENRDGYLCEAEFARGLGRTGVYSVKDAKLEFSRIDSDSDSRVDLKEFTQWYIDQHNKDFFV
eukprot:CAMPEP_0197590994 /NCGR_PEP_ID=MMETSP1326-20131121/12482_1 /TAXON_ID=1155430 /ORGANISM="Genus nov. species nov., Strain RCC2288" /LENGTH=207 /DNA_ID=CAMNT_0043156321 /DNA_START=15 /DNA_END=638 /DNA_ORIENTATION=+